VRWRTAITVPNGYKGDSDVESVEVDNKASCSDATYGGETVSFENTPLTNITVSTHSQVPGATASQKAANRGYAANFVEDHFRDCTQSPRGACDVALHTHGWSGAHIPPLGESLPDVLCIGTRRGRPSIISLLFPPLGLSSVVVSLGGGKVALMSLLFSCPVPRARRS
jgi:hypothetical protein